MESQTIMFVAIVATILCFVVGFIAGWFVNDIVYNTIQQMTTPRLHPELEGISVNEELLSVRVIREDDEEDDYY